MAVKPLGSAPAVSLGLSASEDENSHDEGSNDEDNGEEEEEKEEEEEEELHPQRPARIWTKKFRFSKGCGGCGCGRHKTCLSFWAGNQ